MSTLSLGKFATTWAKTASRQRLGLATLFLLNLLVSTFIAWQIVTYHHYPFDSDEALHANRAVRLTFSSASVPSG